MDTKLLIETLQTTRPFRYLDKKTIESVVCYGKLTQFSANQPIIQQGKQGQGLYTLVRGTAAVTVKVLVEGHIELANLKPGSFFGEVNLLEHTPCTASVISIDNSTCFILSKLSFDMFNVYFPHLYYDIIRSLVEDIVARQANMTINIKKLIKQNLIQLIQKNTLKITQMVKHKKIIHLSSKHLLQRYSYLQQLPIFSILDQHEFCQLMQDISLVQVADNVELIQPRKQKLSSFFILYGAVKLMIDQVNIGVLGPNTLFCPSTIINKAQQISYTTCGTTMLLEITDMQMQKMKEEYKSLWYKFYCLLCLHIVSLLRNLNTQIIRLSSEKQG